MKHKTRDGREILLAELEDLHLINIISNKLDTLEEAKLILTDDAPRNKFDTALYGEVMNEEYAYDFVADFDRAIGPYIAEASIRELDIRDLLDRYRQLVGRKTRVTLSVRKRRERLEDKTSE